MKLRLAAACLVALLLSVSAAQQSPPASSTAPTPTSKDACPDTPQSKTPWFDTSQYAMHGNAVKLGRPVSTPDPQYSEPARKAKIQGMVLLAVAINADGTVDAVKVVCSLEPSLDQNSVDAIKKWKFTPATKDGNPVAVQIEVTTGYHLH